MRKTWFAVWAAAGLVVGCAGTKAPGPSPGGSGLAQLGAAGPQQVAEKASWSDRMLAPFAWMKPSPQSAQKKALAKAQADEARRMAHDPLALSNSADPTAATYVAMAEMACHGGNGAQARGLYQKALSLEPKNLDALLGAARMEDREGRMSDAKMLYERAAAAYPNNPTVFNDLGLCLARQGQLPQAERALARAVQLEPAKPLYRNNIAKVLVELNAMDAAMQHLAAVNPPATANYNVGVLLYQRGRAAEAGTYLTAALAADPQLEPARALLAELQPSAPAYRTARAPQGSAAVAPGTGVEVANAVTPTPSLGAPQIIETSAAAMPGTESAPSLLPPVN